MMVGFPGGSRAAVGRVGFGTAALGGLYEPVDDDTAHAALAAAWAAGTRYFDTAPHYGAGTAERRLGAFLADRPRTSFTVSTKVGRPPGRERDYSGEGVLTSLAESLERTGLDAVDIALIHDPDDHWEQAVGQAYPRLHRLREEGVLGAIGVGMNQAPMPARFVTETDIDCVLLAGRYTLLDRSGESLLSLCARRHVDVVVGGVFNSGVLAAPGPGARYDYAPVPPSVRARVSRLDERCRRYGVPLAAAALQFPFRHPAVSSVLVGARDPGEVAENVRHLDLDIPDELWTELGVPTGEDT